MNLTDYRETYYLLSGKASDAARQLAFAGIALVWVFRASGSPPLTVPRELLVPAALFAFALAMDLAQYSLGTAIWGLFVRGKEAAGVEEEAALSSPIYLTWPQLICFWFKILSVLLAYYMILRFIVAQLSAA